MGKCRMIFLQFPILWFAAIAPSGERVEAPWSDAVPRAQVGKERFAGPQGKAEAPGTRESPWDLESALSGRQAVGPGDVVWVQGGIYKGKFEVKLQGKPGAPAIVRALPGERATILDSHVAVVEPASHLWLWGLEISSSVPLEKRSTGKPGSSPGDLPNRGAAGLDVYSGAGCKFIDLVIHDNVGGGMGWWVGSTDSEVSGCIIYGNGWKGPDRGHGHCIYAQNKDGVKTISGCILTVPLDGSYTIHAYGSSRAYVDNFLLVHNIAYGKGPFLVGGGRPSRGIRVHRNYLHGVDLRIGYGAENEDCEVLDNAIARGKLSIEKYKKAVERGNAQGSTADSSFLIPGRYDPTRAHIAVFNPSGAKERPVAVDGFLRPGDRFRLLDPQDLFGKPVLEGACPGKEIPVPLKGEFAVYVLLKS